MAQMDAYLDIETTGLSPSANYITVIGIFRDCGDSQQLIQLVGPEVTHDKLVQALAGIKVIYTYNGAGFDLPFIRHRLGLNLAGSFGHRDLMFDCWRHNLKGGLKKVEVQLGICRTVTGVDGKEAINLWWQYVNGNDRQALKTLLDYNREDLVNLKTLRAILASKRQTLPPQISGRANI